MKVEVKIPEVGESIQEAVLAQWYRKNGEFVRKGEILFLLETDKVTLEISAEADGVLQILVQEGETVPIGAVVATLDSTGSAATVAASASQGAPATPQTSPKPAQAAGSGTSPDTEKSLPESPAQTPPAPGAEGALDMTLSPAVRRLVVEKGLDPSSIQGTGPGGRITKGDVLLELESGSARTGSGSAAQVPSPPEYTAPRGEGAGEAVTRKPMSRIRIRIAERLLTARQNTAMLTTFNEVDMTRVMEIRSRLKDSFRQRHGVGLGFMSFFLKAAVSALQKIPEMNAFIEGKEIVYHHYYHIGVAIGGERGLVVPVIRHVDRLSFAGIEQAIVKYVARIKENKLELSDLEGGTFTVSNGGVYGSLLSTPILNVPQSGILGLHKVEDRPVVLDGVVAIRPMMYVALSYDHRMVDGREAVMFLRTIKENIEDPERIMMEI